MTKYVIKRVLLMLLTLFVICTICFMLIRMLPREIPQDKNLQEKLSKKLDTITTASWEMLPLHVEFQGAHVISAE